MENGGRRLSLEAIEVARTKEMWAIRHGVGKEMFLP